MFVDLSKVLILIAWILIELKEILNLKLGKYAILSHSNLICILSAVAKQNIFV